jgi:hypothetical protein
LQKDDLRAIAFLTILLAQVEIAEYPDSRKLPGTDAPAKDLALYTNTSPGKAVRVREASVF